MQLTNTPSKIPLAFASSGSKNTIPENSQIGITAGAASLTDGFPPLTLTPLAAGGVPPSGKDLNGILFALSAINRWNNAGGGYKFDSTFATDTNVNGYPQGARILRSDGTGYWINTIDNNVTDPESSGAVAAGWVPDYTYGIASVTMTSANVTLTNLQWGKPIIVISGVLTANLNLIFPAIAGEWVVINNATNAFTITAKTASGTGVVVTGKMQIVGDGTNIYSVQSSSAAAVNYGQIPNITATVASNALTVNYPGGYLDFRNATLTSGTSVVGVSVGALSITVPSGATLGTISGQQARLFVLVAYNGGTPVMCICNNILIDESVLISPTTISSSANTLSAIYSSTTVSANSPWRLVGYVDITESTAGTWATPQIESQGWGGFLSAPNSSRSWQTVTRTNGTTYYNTTGREIYANAWSPLNASSAASYSFTVNGIVIDSKQVGQSGAGVGSAMSCGGPVPAGGSYSWGFTGAIASAAEYR